MNIYERMHEEMATIWSWKIILKLIKKSLLQVVGFLNYCSGVLKPKFNINIKMR